MLEQDRILKINIENEMKSAYIDYSMSVIVSRALPDVRDGLKPVHRRVLYGMNEMGNTSDHPHKKSANCVGEVMGKYHPHGDSSIYGTVVRLAQPWALRYTLVDGHGNFGSVDGDSAAAMRYTEVRLEKIGEEMLQDIEADTVDFQPNYDNSRKEPTVLPTRFPNLLVNGASGIAVGMATNMPPHNLREVINGMNCLIDNPEASLEDLMEFIKGPDFPTAGIIMGRAGIRSAYATGRGKVVVRARTEIVENANGRFSINISELPYQVNKARLIESIADLVKEKRIEGISDINDYSSREGMHVVIDLKRDANPQVVLNQLFNFTQLQISFGVINIALVDGVPKILTLKDILQKYIEHQYEIITRRTVFNLKKAQERAHILEALKKALDFIDEVIAILRRSKTVSEGKTALSERFEFDDIQAQAIVQMRLAQLTGLEKEKIESELEELSEKIADYKDILANESRVYDIIKTESEEIKNRFGDDRKTEIMNVSGEVDIEDLIPEEDCVYTLTTMGYIKRQPVDTYQIQHRGGRGVKGMTRREEDVAETMFTCSTHKSIMFFTSTGKTYKLKGYEVPEGSRTSKGMNIVNILPITQEEKVSAMIQVDVEKDLDKYVCMVTRKGIIKRTHIENYKNIRKTGVIAINLDEDDELAWVKLTSGNDDLLVATKKGMAIRFNETDARELGRTARGVKSITLAKDDEVVGFDVLHEGDVVLTVNEKGYGRRSHAEDYRVQSRGGKGVMNYRVGTFGDVAAIRVVKDDDDVIIISSDGIMIRIPACDISVFARPSKGVKVMRVGEEDKVVTLTTVEHIEIKETENEEKTEESSEVLTENTEQ